MTETKYRRSALIDGAAYREQLIAAGVLRPHPEFTLLDDTGSKLMPKFRTTAADDAAHFLRAEEDYDV